MSKTTVTFLGTGSAFEHTRPATSLLYQGAACLLLDCGYSVPRALWRQSRDPDLLDGVYLTHLHADHTFGVPVLLNWMKSAGRQRPLAVFGGPGIKRMLWGLLDLGYPGSFSQSYPIQAVEIPPGARVLFEGVQLMTALSAHKVDNYAVRLSEDGRIVCYSGDGAPTDATRELFGGADSVAHECFQVEHGKRDHACAEHLLAMADALSIQQLALVHVAPEARAALGNYVAAWTGWANVTVPSPGDRITVT